jgi:hypothetical protein
VDEHRFVQQRSDFYAGDDGGHGTDSIELSPVSKRNAVGRFEIKFFARGLRHFNQKCVHAVNSLKKDDRLRLVRDPQNDVDAFALFMRTENSIHLLGYIRSSAPISRTAFYC